MNLKKKLAAVGLSLGLLAGGAVVTAPAAQAFSAQNCFRPFGTNDRMCYIDYSWWEESWMGGSHHDYWRTEYGVYNGGWANCPTC